jgi:hypothetical protein
MTFRSIKYSELNDDDPDREYHEINSGMYVQEAEVQDIKMGLRESLSVAHKVVKKGSDSVVVVDIKDKGKLEYLTEWVIRID